MIPITSTFHIIRTGKKKKKVALWDFFTLMKNNDNCLWFNSLDDHTTQCTQKMPVYLLERIEVIIGYEQSRKNTATSRRKGEDWNKQPFSLNAALHQ